MDAFAFDRIAAMLSSRATRRRAVALIASGTLLSLASGDDLDAAGRGRKKRTRKNKKRRDRCLREGATCREADVCCSATCDFLVNAGTCAPCRGRSCNAERPCCGGLDCQDGFCGGCRDRATSCTADAQCCFSDCTGGACLSALGGPCARDVDCRKCYLNGLCTNACVNGACTV